MIKRYFIMAIAAAFALVACTKNFDEPRMEIQPTGSENVHTLSVGIEAGAYVPVDGQTKASTEAVIRVKWEEGDKISVVNASTGKILGGYLEADETGESVTFSGTVTGTIEQTDQLYYVYPRIVDNAEAVDFDEAGYDISLANQTYNGSDISKVSFYGYAEDKVSSNDISKKIKFNLVTSYAHLNMAGLPAKGADLNTLDVSNVNEGFTWTLNGSWLKVEPYAGSNSISVSCTNTKITQAGNAVVRFAIPASAATEQARVLTVNKAYKNDGYVKAELKSSSYYNQLYTIWVSSNVEVEDKGDKKEVTIDNEGSTEKAEGILPVADAFGNKPTEIGIGGVGTITFDATASAKIKENADDANSTNVFFKVEDVTETKPVENVNLVYEVTMKTVDGNGVEVFSESKSAGVATVTVPLGEDVQDVTSVKLVNDSGVEIEGGVVPESVHFENGILSFQVNHFSKYAIKYTSKETPGSYVAQIGSRKYTTLANAIAAVQNGNTIEMLANVTDANGISVPKDAKKTFTVDFGGHIYTCLDNPTGSTNTTNQVFQLNAGNTITFKNGTISVAEANKSKFRFIIQNYTDLTLENMTLDGSNLAIDKSRYTLSNNAGNINLTGNTTIKAAAENGVAFDVYHWQEYYPTAPVLTWNSTGTVEGNIELTGGKLIIASDLEYANTIVATEGTSTLEVNATLSATSASDWYLVKAGKEGVENVTLNISGTGTLTSGNSEHCIPVTSDHGAQVNISDGTYNCYGDGECVYANRDGKVSISGGTFGVRSGDTVKDLLNVQNDQEVTDIQCTGGTFIGRDPALGDDAKGGSFVANGYVSTENPTGTWTVVECPNVAKIGNTEYATLADAIAAVPANTQTTITMIGNDYYEENNPIKIGKDLNVVLDLNGKTVSAVAPSEGGATLITNYGALTIKDSGSNGRLLMLATSPDGREIPGYASNTVTNNGKLVVNGGIIENQTTSSAGQACYPIDNITNGGLYSPTVEINGGQLIAKSNAALRLFCNSTTKENKVTINGGYFEAVYYAVSMQNPGNSTTANIGNLVITDGIFEATADDYNCSVCNWTKSDEFSISITGGKFNDNVIIADGNKSVSVTGGKFKYDKFTDPDDGITYKLSDYLARDYELVFEDGYYTIQEVSLPWSTEYPQAFVSQISNDGLDVAYSFNAYNSSDMEIASKLIDELSHCIDLGRATELTDDERTRIQTILSQAEPYAGWNADFEVSFDKPVAAGSLELSGQYLSFSADWLPFPMKELNANQTYRLLKDNDYMSVSMTYEEICTKVITFNCGAINYSQGNIGTTMTVQLRLYVNDGGNGFDGETGQSYKIGEYKYTFDKVKVK